MTDATQFREYNDWLGRKGTSLRRPALDCRCPNGGEVYFHLWCDRLSCREHAQDEHDCGEYAGVKSSSEEGSEPLEAEAPARLVWPFGIDAQQPRPGLAACRGCRQVALVLPDAKLCGPCGELPSCDAERSNERTGRRMVCFRPQWHDGVHEDLVSGSQWARPLPSPEPEDDVEALRQEQVDITALTDSPRPSKISDLYAALRARARRGGPNS